MSTIGQVLFNLFILYAAARLAGTLFTHLKQPSVVGEILVGVIIGPYALGLVHYEQSVVFFEVFAELGVIFLLFVVGLETNPSSLWSVGRHAATVGSFGVALPFTTGYFGAHLLGYNTAESLFMGVALTATSVGITARVFDDLGAIHTRVASVILGAAVLDDILGISVLSVVEGATQRGVDVIQILVLMGEAVAFIIIALALARPAVHRLAPRLAKVESDEARDPIFAFAIILCFGFSALAVSIQLAAIIGAFFAGLLFAEMKEADRLRDSMRPIYEFLVPIFFVFMGLQVNLRLFNTGATWVIASLIIAMAIASKLIACGIAALPLGKREALAVGVGMIPRGEVGIVVALVGLRTGILTDYLYAVIIFMSIVTSLVAPPFLRLLLPQRKRPSQDVPPREEPPVADQPT